MTPQRLLPHDRWQVVGAFLTIILLAVAISVWNDYRIDQAEKRINTNAEKAAIASARIAALRVTQRAQNKLIRENAKTAFALCDAAAGARDFWIGVRRTTMELLADPTLSPIERRANEHFVDELDKVIFAAHNLAHSCD